MKGRQRIIIMSNYYDVLGCKKGASYEELKKCYHELAKKYHPDKAGNIFQKEFLLLDKAWKTLQNAEARRDYDLMISKNELDETPMYCEVDLSEMSHIPETSTYNYGCRCGGIYVLDGRLTLECEMLKVSCDECTFHIVVNLHK